MGWDVGPSFSRLLCNTADLLHGGADRRRLMVRVHRRDLGLRSQQLRPRGQGAEEVSVYLYGARVCAVCVSAGLRFMSRRRSTYRGGQKGELAPLVFLKFAGVSRSFRDSGFRYMYAYMRRPTRPPALGWFESVPTRILIRSRLLIGRPREVSFVVRGTSHLSSEGSRRLEYPKVCVSSRAR